MLITFLINCFFVYLLKTDFMATIVRNKITIIPNSTTEEGYSNQINDVAKFCGAMEDGINKVVSFTKIAPKIPTFEADSKEEDDWLLRNWGTRFKALNSCWISDTEIIFDTFWNPAIPIFNKIAKAFPNTDFSFKFSSKRAGIKTGEINASSGKIVYFKKFKNFSKEAYEITFELMPHMRNLYTLNQKTETYEYDTSDFNMEISQKGFYKESDGTVLIGCDDKNKPLFDAIDDLPF